MSSSIHPARLIVGGLYLLKAFFAVVMLVLGLVGTLPALLGAPALGGLGMIMIVVVFGGMAAVWGAIGVGLLKGSRLALMIAIAVAALNAIACLGAGAVPGFFIEAAIAVGLLMSRSVRSAYGD